MLYGGSSHQSTQDEGLTLRVQQSGDTQILLSYGEGLIQVLQVGLSVHPVHIDQHGSAGRKKEKKKRGPVTRLVDIEPTKDPIELLNSAIHKQVLKGMKKVLKKIKCNGPIIYRGKK